MAHDDHAELTTPPPPVGPGYEVHDTNTRAVAIGGAILFAVVVVVLIGLLAVYRRIGATHPRHEDMTPPVTLATELAALRQHEDDVLRGYGWVDRKAGVVRVPIDRALEIVAERGVPKGKGPRTDVQINSRDRGPEPDAEKKKDE